MVALLNTDSARADAAVAREGRTKSEAFPPRGSRTPHFVAHASGKHPRTASRKNLELVWDEKEAFSTSLQLPPLPGRYLARARQQGAGSSQYSSSHTSRANIATQQFSHRKKPERTLSTPSVSSRTLRIPTSVQQDTERLPRYLHPYNNYDATTEYQELSVVNQGISHHNSGAPQKIITSKIQRVTPEIEANNRNSRLKARSKQLQSVPSLSFGTYVCVAFFIGLFSIVSFFAMSNYEQTPTSSDTASHSIVVHSGDSLADIAHSYAPDLPQDQVIESIMRANHLAQEHIYPGQTLHLPNI